MIVIEGPDGSGKSTLFKYILERLPLFSEHSPSHLVKSKEIDHWLLWIEWSLMETRDDWIFDRYPVISEMVYGPIFRDVNLIEGTEYFARFIETKPLIIYCRPHSRQIHYNVEQTAQEDYVREGIQAIIEEYDDLMDALKEHTTVINYNYGHNKPRGLIRQIVDYLAGRPVLQILQGGKK